VGIDLKGDNDCTIVNEMMVHTKDPNWTPINSWGGVMARGLVVYSTTPWIWLVLIVQRGHKPLRVQRMCIGWRHLKCMGDFNDC
jgi:hypothetical protein